jgi:Ca-activated chloride channel homolog
MNDKSKKHFKSGRTAAVLLSFLLTDGCGGSNVTAQSNADTEKPTARIASGQVDAQPAGKSPSFHFEPKSHAPIYRKTEAAVPDLSDFPAMKMRYAQCFGERRFSERGIARSPIATGAPSPLGGVRKSPPKAAEKSRTAAKGASGAVPPASSKSMSADMSGGAVLPSVSAPNTAYEQRRTRKTSEPKKTAMTQKQKMKTPQKEESMLQASVPQEIAAEENEMPRPETEQAANLEAGMGYRDWGQSVYLSNDDTMSLSSAQRIIWAVDNFQPLPPEHIRPHELLNYFSFDTEQVQDGYDFSVAGDLTADPNEEGIYSLALAVRGRPVDKISRRNAVLTFVIDRSGSMNSEGRMDYLKRGLLRMTDELKDGDMVHLVVFDHEVCTPMENFVAGRDSKEDLKEVIRALTPRGSTDLHRGLAEGYETADRTYKKEASNRVVLITDALTNTGVQDERMISMISQYYDTRRIRLSGVGVGRNFNDSLLDKLTERGKGAYVFLGSDAEVDAVFGARFISLIETTALDVRFRLHLPPSLRMNVFYGEESSTVKEDVQEIHYFANTEQLFLSDLMAKNRTLTPEDDIMLTIEYKDPETENPLVEEYAFNLAELLNRGTNAKKGRLITAWADLLAETAARPIRAHGRYTEGSFQDEEGWRRCEQGKQLLSDAARDISSDTEVKRVLKLFDKYCARYERPRHPIRRKIAVPERSWPGAEGAR